jgi:hypothetical protein
MDEKYCLITNEVKKITIKDMIKILILLVNSFKKINSIIDEIQTLILKFNDGIFDNYNNIQSVKQVLLKSIETCYLNIQMILNISYKSIQILNYTSDSIPPPGLTINYLNTSIHINSYRVLYSKDGIIKLVEYDKNFKPLNINWIGTHLNKINKISFNKRLSKCFNNNLKTINTIKVKCANYIQLINNLQKIIE